MNRTDYFSLSQLGLPEDVWEPLIRCRSPLSCPAGQILYLQGAPADRFYLILEGKVRTYISNEDGTERLLTVYHPGNLCGEASFFDQMPRVSSAVTITPCKLVPIDRTAMTELLNSRPELAFALLKYLARTVRLLSTQVDDLSFAQADRRLARILAASGLDGQTVHLSQEELAETIGTSRVTVSRILSRFAKEGLVTLGYRQITLLDRKSLLELAGK